MKFLGDRPGKISANGRDKFIIEARNEQQSKKMTEMSTISGKSNTAEQHRTLNRCQGIVYIYEYNIEDFDSFETGLKTLHPIKKVIRANWLKSRNEYAKPFLITFSSTNLPDMLRIPGERPTKVYKYYNKPMLCYLCMHCQSYSHTYKYSKKIVAVCSRRADSGHSK